eukprot:TRINITY_DN57688_c0_g1_i1.p1 TRINITY_DN57688_c0_g1~~TRINITY_DN57688_c0_g1_i1.p1  ORF type:complete len:175 (+),score=49.99 TRINITY_DN57688_c0_g1_i1:70-594(+)
MSSRSCSESSDSWSSAGLLWEGAMKGDTSKVREALEEGADVNSAANNKGSTSLHLASCEGHVEVVKLLLDHGADPNHLDRSGWSALDRAVWAGRMGVCTVLLERGARVDVRDNINRTPLHATAIQGNLSLAKLLVEHGADRAVRDTRYHQTPAEWARRYHRQGVWEFLNSGKKN